jgi:hypothetical protein
MPRPKRKPEPVTAPDALRILADSRKPNPPRPAFRGQKLRWPKQLRRRRTEIQL